LPPDKRRAIRALYAVCRVSDNIVDCTHGEALAALRDWRHRVLAPECPPGDPVLRAWNDIRLRYGIPQRYMEQLLNGVAQDLCPRRLATFDELAAYAYGVASTVGLMSMHIIGYSGDEAVPYAIKLGVALQLTNVLRDVGEDWRDGRLYLPLAELARFELT
jgi:phytoene synthase